MSRYRARRNPHLVVEAARWNGQEIEPADLPWVAEAFRSGLFLRGRKSRGRLRFGAARPLLMQPPGAGLAPFEVETGAWLVRYEDGAVYVLAPEHFDRTFMPQE